MSTARRAATPLAPSARRLLAPRFGSEIALTALAAVLVFEVAASRAWGQSSSLVLGIQDRRLNVDTGLLPGLDPVYNTQTSVRASFTWDVSERLTLVAQGGGARSWLELSDAYLAGPTDLRLRALYRPSPEWALGAGTIVPFGLYELSAGEVTTAQWAWIPGRGFPLHSFGEGWGWEATVARAFSLDEGLTLGIAGAWLHHAEFALLENGAADYRLGDEASLTVGADRDFGAARQLRLDMVFHLYGTDQLSGRDHVDQGNQVELGASVDYPFGPLNTSWAARAMIKGDNRITDRSEPDSIASFSQAPGAYLALDGRVAHALSASWVGFLAGHLSQVSGSDYLAETADGTTVSAGPGLGWRTSDALSLSLRYAYVTGTGAQGLKLHGHDVLFTLELRR